MFVYVVHTPQNEKLYLKAKSGALIQRISNIYFNATLTILMTVELTSNLGIRMYNLVSSHPNK